MTELTQQRKEAEQLDERYWPDGHLKWTHPIDVGHLILQLQTLDPKMKVSSVTFIETKDGTKARAYGLSMSRERWDESGWLNFKLPIPECLAIWANQPLPEIEGLSGRSSLESENAALRKELLESRDAKSDAIFFEQRFAQALNWKRELESENERLREALRIAEEGFPHTDGGLEPFDQADMDMHHQAGDREYTFDARCQRCRFDAAIKGGTNVSVRETR